ncbi:MAG: hypothetical protein FWD78_07885 [Treponema sp.]|nr:hypothetical protein [Treponema sp.]
MKITKSGLFLLAALLLIGVMACKSTPPPEEPPPPQEEVIVPDPDLAPPSQASLDSLNDAIARADKARTMVTDFDGPDYFPADWTAAESLNTAAVNGKKTATVKDVRESLALYNASAAAYEALAEKTIPKYADDLTNDVMAARDAAIASGAAYLAPEYLQGTDDFALGAQDKYDAKDYYAAKDDGLLVRDAYNALASGVEAYKVRLELQDRDFVYYDQSNIAAADDIALSALDDYEAHNIASADSKARDVRARYEQSLAKAWESYAADCAAAANSERQKALDAKANVAVKQDFDTANSVYSQGVAAHQSNTFDQAANLYNQARDMFAAATKTTLDKRSIAEQGLRAAELKMVESDEIAQRAELIIEGGSR